jgi:hypothetical protein
VNKPEHSDSVVQLRTKIGGSTLVNQGSTTVILIAEQETREAEVKSVELADVLELVVIVDEESFVDPNEDARMRKFSSFVIAGFAVPSLLWL